MPNPDTTEAGMLEHADRNAAIAIAREANAKAMRAADLEDEIERLRAAINEAYRILCSGKPPHSARETNARRVLRLAGAGTKEIDDAC